MYMHIYEYIYTYSSIHVYIYIYVCLFTNIHINNLGWHEPINGLLTHTVGNNWDADSGVGIYVYMTIYMCIIMPVRMNICI
jgi:hypothetical protein